MMERSFLYFDEGDDLEADLANAFVTPGGVAEIIPCPESLQGESYDCAGYGATFSLGRVWHHY